MRPAFLRAALCLVAFILSACLSRAQAATIATAAPPTPSPIPFISTSPPQRAPLLRMAILGDVTTTNVWALFERMDYWEHATQASYWPRLYSLSPLSLDPSTRSGQRPEPAAATSASPSLVCDSATCAATVTLRPGLRWTDGSPLTANDVAFTVNIALQFRLGGGWNSAYDPQTLDHAEAISQDTVRFYFKRQPSVAEWQYGALLGPIVNRAYWQPRIAEAVGLLPEESLWTSILELEKKSAELQAQMDALNLSLNEMAPASEKYQQTVKQVGALQDEWNSLIQKQDKMRRQYEQQLTAARMALYALPNAAEPTLGAWQFASRLPGVFENKANRGTIYGDPWFDKVRYSLYASEQQAVQALLNDETDLILTPEGLSPESVAQLAGNPAITLSRTSSRRARFLAFNQANLYLADVTLRQALACMLDTDSLAHELGEGALPLTDFVLEQGWRAEGLSPPCAALSAENRLAQAVRLLKAAGYAWRREPTSASNGEGLLAPNGTPVPRLSLLTLADTEDGLRAQAAEYAAQQAASLGLEIQVLSADEEALLYAVYGSGSYDLAVLGWRLSQYPAYLCDWFTPQGPDPFAYNGSRLRSACEAWRRTSDLPEARERSAQVQSILMEELPLIPLYVEARYDAYRHLRYPFEAGIGGLGEAYGAPEKAIPNP